MRELVISHHKHCGGTGGKKSNCPTWRTISLKNIWLQVGHQQTKSWKEREDPSYQRHDQKGYPQRKTAANVVAFQYEISLVSREPLAHGCLQWPRPVLQEINSHLCSCSYPHSSCWWCPRKVFLNSALTQAGVSLIDLRGKSLNLSPSPQGRSLPFLTVVCKIQYPLLFLQLPVFQRRS